MASVAKLKADLKKAEEAEKNKSLGKELKEQRKQWLGKARSTHTFQRIREQIHAYVEKVIDVVLINDVVLLKVETIEFMRNNEGVRIEVKEVHKAWHQYHHYTHDITVEQYDILKDTIKTELIGIGEKFREGMHKPDEHHTMGDHSDYRNIKERLLNAKVPFIDLTGKPEFIRMLAWQKHPMLMGKVLLITEYTEQILYNIRDEFVAAARRSMSGRNMRNHSDDADIISAIIKYYKNNAKP